MNTTRFEDIRPYYDHEVKEAMQRIAENPLIEKVQQNMFPDVPLEVLKEKVRNTKTAYEFQTTFMYMAMNAIMAKTTNGCSTSGFDRMKKDGSYILLANHRDIILDSGILQVKLHEHGFESSEMSFGSNLMMSEFIVDIGKSNKMYKTIRATNKKELIENSKHLSDYLRYTITEKHSSTWIAHRNGRTKDGNDRTEPGLLRMLSMTGVKEFVPNFWELNITPVSVSYEYEPCAAEKIREIYLSSKGPYVKQPGEDLQSIISGVKGYKGGMHLAIGNTVSKAMLEEADALVRNEKYTHLAALIDREIYRNYKLWKTNFMAFDMLMKGEEFVDKYSREDLELFTAYMNKTIEKVVEGPRDIIENLFLKLYANPVINRKKVE